jgi:hypothetical protein
VYTNGTLTQRCAVEIASPVVFAATVETARC